MKLIRTQIHSVKEKLEPWVAAGSNGVTTEWAQDLPCRFLKSYNLQRAIDRYLVDFEFAEISEMATVSSQGLSMKHNLTMKQGKNSDFSISESKQGYSYKSLV